MPRIIANTAIMAKTETTPGTDAVPVNTTDALLISNASFDYSYNNVNRDLMRGYLGSSGQLAGTRFVDLAFDVELASSGTAGTAPAWGKLLRACAFAEVVTAGQRVEYTPVSSAFETLTIYYYDDGVLKKALGCMGSAEIGLGEGERPMLKFKFSGLDGGLAAVATPSMTLTAWKAPLAVTDQNTGDLTFGGTYAAGAITGGTSYPSRGLQLSLGNSLSKLALLGGQSVGITGRDVSGSAQFDLTAAQEVSFMTDINANTLTTMSLLHGTTAGNKVLVFAPAVQRINPKQAEYEGYRHLAVDLSLQPSAGNDELRIVAL